MSVEAYNLILHGSATMPDDDTTTEIGGAIDKSTKLTFAQLANTGVLNVISSAAGDTTQDITVYGRNAAGEKVNEAISLNGTTEAQGAISFERVMKAIKSATTTGVVALYSDTNLHSGTAQDGDTNWVQLDVGASGTDNEYQFDVIVFTGGTGAGNVAEIVKYDGTEKKAYVRGWPVATPDATSQFIIAHGAVMEKSPDEIDEVRVIAYDAAANPQGGAQKVYYEKGFWYNQHATLALTNAVISEVAEGAAAKIEFALEDALDGSGTNGVGNDRFTAPSSGLTADGFSSAAKNVVNSQNFSPQSGQGVWFKLTLDAGDAAQKSFYKLQVTGQST